MKKLIGFDLDGTLAESKSAITADIADLLRQLLSKYEVVVTSGGKFGQFKAQLIDNLQASDQQLLKLHILPTNAADYYRYDPGSKSWLVVFSSTIPRADRAKITSLVEKVARKLGYWEDKHWGPIIEDRGSQVTFSALGQEIVAELGEEGLRKKQAWDPDGTKKQRLRDELAKELPNFKVAVGGITSVDIIQPTVNKAAGLAKLGKMLGITKAETLYIGDALQPGGNDAVVKEAGYETWSTTGSKETAQLIERLLVN